MKPSNALFSAVLLSAGCAAHSEPDKNYAGSQLSPMVDEQVAADLEALRSLELFEVGRLVIADADVPGACYGECPDEERRREVFAHQAERLHALTALAQDLRTDEPSGAVEDDLAALNALEIVSLGDFITKEAEPSPYCYNLPCPEEQARVDAENAENAAKVAALRDAARGL